VDTALGTERRSWGRAYFASACYAHATFDAMTPRPDCRQLLWYTLSTVMLATLTILLIVSFL